MILLLLGACSSPPPCDGELRGLRALVVRDGEVELVDAGRLARDMAVDGDGVAWTVEGDRVEPDGSRLDADEEWVAPDLAWAGGRAALVSSDWPSDELLLADPAGGELTVLDEQSYSGVIASGDDRLVLVEHSRIGSDAGPIRVWTELEGGWSAETLEFVADWTPLAAASDAERVAFTHHREGGFGVVLGESGSWTVIDELEAWDVWSMVLGGDGSAWVSVDGLDHGDDAGIVHAGVCATRLLGFERGAALTASDDGVTAWGFAEDGAPWRADVGADCSFQPEPVGEPQGVGLTDVRAIGSGSIPVVLAEFYTGDDGGDFAEAYVPACY